MHNKVQDDLIVKKHELPVVKFDSESLNIKSSMIEESSSFEELS